MNLSLNQNSAADPDDALVRRLKWRAPGAFDELIDIYQARIYGFIYRLLDDPADAPDVTQEVFIRIFRKIDDFRGDSSFKTWLYKIAVRQASNRRRWFSRHRRQEVCLDGPAQAGNGFSGWDWLADPRDTPYDSYRNAEQRSVIEEALGDVDERLRVAIVLRDIQGLAYSEIAEALDISLGTVKSRILRGRAALKAQLERRMGEALQGASLQTE